MILLVPGDPLSPRQPDDHFRREAIAADALGIEVQVIDHDALVAGRSDEAVRRVKGEGPSYAVYRGWMVTSEQYRAMDQALVGRGVCIRTSPDQYQTAHELPGWYDAFREITPLTFWTDRDLMSLPALLRNFSGPAVVKDYVKSLKHHWDAAMFMPDTSDVDACRRVIQSFLIERGGDFVGHVVVRAFEDFQPVETRTWWVNGECLLVTAHPDRPHECRVIPQDFLDKVRLAVASVGNPFVTVDIAMTTASEHRVVEMGDGQVSDLPSSVAPEMLLSGLSE